MPNDTEIKDNDLLCPEGCVILAEDRVCSTHGGVVLCPHPECRAAKTNAVRYKSKQCSSGHTPSKKRVLPTTAPDATAAALTKIVESLPEAMRNSLSGITLTGGQGNASAGTEPPPFFTRPGDYPAWRDSVTFWSEMSSRTKLDQIKMVLLKIPYDSPYASKIALWRDLDEHFISAAGLKPLLDRLDKEHKETDRLEDLTIWSEFINCHKRSGESLIDFTNRYETSRLKCHARNLKSTDWMNCLNLLVRAELPMTSLTLTYNALLDKADTMDDKDRYSMDSQVLVDLAAAKIKSLANMQSLQQSTKKHAYTAEELPEPEDVMAAERVMRQAGYTLTKPGGGGGAASRDGGRRPKKDLGPHPNPNWRKKKGAGPGQYTNWGALRRCSNCKKGIPGKQAACSHDERADCGCQCTKHFSSACPHPRQPTAGDKHKEKEKEKEQPAQPAQATQQTVPLSAAAWLVDIRNSGELVTHEEADNLAAWKAAEPGYMVVFNQPAGSCGVSHQEGAGCEAESCLVDPSAHSRSTAPDCQYTGNYVQPESTSPVYMAEPETARSLSEVRMWAAAELVAPVWEGGERVPPQFPAPPVAPAILQPAPPPASSSSATPNTSLDPDGPTTTPAVSTTPDSPLSTVESVLVYRPPTADGPSQLAEQLEKARRVARPLSSTTSSVWDTSPVHSDEEELILYPNNAVDMDRVRRDLAQLDTTMRTISSVQSMDISSASTEKTADPHPEGAAAGPRGNSLHGRAHSNVELLPAQGETVPPVLASSHLLGGADPAAQAPAQPSALALLSPAVKQLFTHPPGFAPACSDKSASAAGPQGNSLHGPARLTAPPPSAPGNLATSQPNVTTELRGQANAADETAPGTSLPAHVWLQQQSQVSSGPTAQRAFRASLSPNHCQAQDCLHLHHSAPVEGAGQPPAPPPEETGGDEGDGAPASCNCSWGDTSTPMSARLSFACRAPTAETRTSLRPPPARTPRSCPRPSPAPAWRATTPARPP